MTWLSDHFWAVFLIVANAIFWSVDAWRFYVSGKPTFSQKIIGLTERFPLLPFIVGFLIGLVVGHWWW